ncbi:MAG: hypothetical protein M1812_002098 [Candelaria pacifica]|nr:MAG: hypothetical protein M1812_002098 [Candelaria pacifica]
MPYTSSKNERSSKFKKLIIACDGTWQDSDNGYVQDPLLPSRPSGHLQIPSNVTRISRAIESEDQLEVPQVVYYQAGVGASNSIWEHFVGGATGLGLSENIREAYSFIANNYAAGDEIFLLGFSRGAFTARSIAGLIGTIGLLTKKGLVDFYAIFKDYENGWNQHYKDEFPNTPFSDKPSINDMSYAKELETRGLSTLNIPIKAIGVWDTVGSLGIPRISWLDKLSIPKSKEYAFYDTNLNDNIEYAFQALALDEHRGPFSPAVWEKPNGSKTHLKQVWFPGVHSNVGGGYPDAQLENITLAWMIAQLQELIHFAPEYILHQNTINSQYYIDQKQHVRPWGLGRIYNSLKGVYYLAGSKVRTPGQYRKADPDTGLPTAAALLNTNEFIHASVRIRLGLGGHGAEDKGDYKCEALKDWRLKGVDADTLSPDNGGAAKERIGIRWEHGSAEKGGSKVLYEDILGFQEMKLLETSPQVVNQIMTVTSPTHVGMRKPSTF